MRYSSHTAYVQESPQNGTKEQETEMPDFAEFATSAKTNAQPTSGVTAMERVQQMRAALEDLEMFTEHRLVAVLAPHPHPMPEDVKGEPQSELIEQLDGALRQVRAIRRIIERTQL